MNASWFESFKKFVDARSITMLGLGFSAGLPYFLIFSTLSLWLREAGLDRSTVTFFSWAALGYSFKFVWAPLVDKLPLPLLSKWLGRRRGWLVFSQLLVAASICAIAFIDPAVNEQAIIWMAFAAVALGFSAATQDICIDAFRIESAEESMQATLSAMYIAGYRVGMLLSGAGALVLASRFGTEMGAYDYFAWQSTYLVMASFMVVGVITAIIRPEPVTVKNPYSFQVGEYARFFLLFACIVGLFVLVYISTNAPSTWFSDQMQSVHFPAPVANFISGSFRFIAALAVVFISYWLLRVSALVNTQLLEEGYIEPVKAFFAENGRHAALILLVVVGLYRISDIVLGAVANLFYQDMGFSKEQIAFVVKTFGLGMTLLGGFVGGLLTNHYGIYRILLWGAVLAATTNLLFMWFAFLGPSEPMLYIVISADNLAGGIAIAAFVAFLSSLTNISFTAVQYAIFSSIMTLIPKFFGGYSGTIVDVIDYPGFFLITTIIGIPVVWSVIKCKHYIKS